MPSIPARKKKKVAGRDIVAVVLAKAIQYRLNDTELPMILRLTSIARRADPTGGQRRSTARYHTKSAVRTKRWRAAAGATPTDDSR